MLDKIESKVLYALDKDSRMPDTELAKYIRRAKSTTAYRIEQLNKRGIIASPTIWIDPTKLGYQTYKAYLKIRNIPEDKKKLMEAIKKEPSVFWLGAADGAWDIGLTVFAKNNKEFYEFEQRVLAPFDSLIREKHLGVLVDVHVFTKDFLVENPETEEAIMFSEPSNIVLDDIEKKLIKALLKDSRATVVSLSEQVGISIDIVRARMKKLEREKVIARYTTPIDYHELGLEFYKTFLYLKSISKEQERTLVEWIKRQPRIVHYVRQISPWHLELETLCENYHQYLEIMNELQERFSDLIMDIETALMNEDHVFPAGISVLE